MELTVFGFTLQKVQIDTIYMLFYKEKDFLLHAKTGLGKSLIFQFLPFLFDFIGVVIIFIPLKPLQVEQNSMINYLSSRKIITLTSKNNQKAIQQSIWSLDYSHVFTSPKIALSKKFKAIILDNPRFARGLCFLAIGKIYLVEKWDKSFRPLYTKIKKVQKRIPPHIPQLRIFITLTKGMQLCLLFKAGFKDKYHLHTSLRSAWDKANLLFHDWS